LSSGPMKCLSSWWSVPVMPITMTTSS